MAIRLMREVARLRIPSSAQVFIVSFPRSGHHALMGFLNKVSNFTDNYCEFYSCTKHNGEEIPCKFDGTNKRYLQGFGCGAGKPFIKNHDFDLGLPYSLDMKYIVQYRHPFLSIRSWYEMESKKGKPLPPWESFFDEKLSEWVAFIDKWVGKYGQEENVFLMPYDSLKDLNKVIEVADFAGAQIKPDLADIVHNFHPKRSLEFDSELQAREKALSPWLELAGVTPLFNE